MAVVGAIQHLDALPSSMEADRGRLKVDPLHMSSHVNGLFVNRLALERDLPLEK